MGLVVTTTLLLAACGSGTQSAIETGIAQTQQISQLETAAAGVADTATPEPEASEEPTATEAATTGVTTIQDLNMRAGDSTAYDVMTVIPGGETVEIVGVNQGGTWYQVRYHDALGWISMGFTQGDAPADLPVVTPSAKPSSSGNGSSSGGSGGGDNDSYSFTLDVSHDGDSSTVQGQLAPGDKDTVTVKFEGFGGSVDIGHLQVILNCSAHEDDVELSESIPRSNHSNECNGDWDYQIEPSDSQLVIGMALPSGMSGNVDWVMTVKVHNN